ncbi:RHS repeat-associated core domain-containing protein [Streptomyces turgidiscabies]|uniref:RHS repeat-associated protein n=1 Tax=Streptomyces turgidiscabies TaxID=85558 RepID=A0ABU0RHJ8_9ACTN|nr:RHS repeat-associated core domain-containing protein [Streptomyces turgidiscabies]MDQ0931467.1 RHS repeat-associated protein [Streptomyces turgidiscabies]
MAASAVTLTEPDGAKVEFTKQSNGTFTAPKPVRYVLTQTSSGFTVTSTDHTSRVFNASGRMTGWLDGAGQGLAFSYSDTKLTEITDAAGRDTTVDVDVATGRLNSVTLSDGRKVTYGYEAGQLARVTGTDGGVTQYTYTGGRLATVVDPRGNTVTQNTYDGTTGRIRSQIDAHGGTFSFTWKAATGAPAGSGESNMTDPAGGIWTDIYEAGVLMRSYRPKGGGTDRVYDQNLNPTAEYDANSNKTSRTFDARGNIATQETGGVTEKASFDTSDRLKSVTNGRGYSTSYEYNGSSDRIKTAAGPAGTTSYTYTSNGQIETETAPRGGTTRYTYTGAGLVESVTAPGGGKTTYGYDAADRLKTETDPRGNVAGANPAEYTTSYDYDAQGRLSKITDPASQTTTYGYDDNGNVKTVTDALGQVTSYEYNKANQQTKAIGSDGKYSTMEYDARGNQTAAVDETGRRTTYGYDGAGRRSSMTTPRGNVTGADAAKFTTTYGYDDNGNLIKTVDPTGAVTSTEYDAFDQPTKVTDPLNHVTLTGYDVNGNVAQVTDPLTKITKYTYTSADLLETVTDPLSKVTTYGYDADGNRTSETSPTGRKQTWTYNADGQPETQTDPRGYLTGNTASDYTTRYGYDATGNQTSVTDPYGRRQTRAYDNLGQLTASQDASGRRTTYAYDPLGRIETVTAPDAGTTAYTYDTSGNVHTRTDANQHTTTYGYDSAHRLTSVVDPLNRTVAHRYDADGNRDQTTNARGIVATNTYDALNRLTGTKYSDTTPVTSIAYDAVGNRRQVVDATGTRTFAYDAVDRLKTVTLPTSKTFAYGYDDAGHLTSRTNPDGQQTTYTYNSDGDRLTATTNSLKTTYAHAFPGLLTGVTLPNGYTESRTYDRALMLTDVVSSNSTKTLSSWHGVPDGDGRPQRVDQVRNNTGSTTAKSEYYTYDETGRLNGDCSSATKADTCPSGSPTTAYTYDKVGNRLTQTGPNSGTTYSYDAADQLTQTVTGAATTNYTYDADGNQTTDGIDALAYDAANRLRSKGTTTYTYDVDGNRATAVKSGTTTSYTWDINNELPLLAGESTGSRSAAYSYNELGQIESTKQAQGTFYYHHDLIGTVTDLTNSTGRDAANYTFGPFGENATNLNIGAEDAPINRFGFTGEYTDQTIRNDFDAVATSINLRARNYDPNTGRFTGRDPYVPDASTPYTQSYAYVENAPTSRTDPSGMCSITTQMKDLFTGKWGWGSDCVKEDTEARTLPPAVQSMKAVSEKITKGAVEATGQASLGLVDGLTFGAFTSFGGAEVTCPSAYNVGLYSSMVPFPIGSGGKRLAVEGAEVAGRGLWTLNASRASKIMKGGPFKTTFYKSASDGTWWTADVTGHGGSAFKVYEETKKGLEWIKDADRFGTYMENKWKGGTGRFIPWSQLRGVGK